jgi:hypothetical protein
LWPERSPAEKQLAFNLVERLSRDTNTACFGDRLEARRKVHTTTVNILTVDHYVAEMEANTELHVLSRAVQPHVALNFGCAESCFNDNSSRIPSPISLTTRRYVWRLLARSVRSAGERACFVLAPSSGCSQQHPLQGSQQADVRPAPRP